MNNDKPYIITKSKEESPTWSNIEIFLFTNGQQYSPPRKYHIKTKELYSWENTLHHLARSQFGSMHSNIELYSIDGIKIDGPLKMSNGGAYVAVKPPDSFVQSGYSQYLIKASRSWERRQERLNKTGPTHPDGKRDSADIMNQTKSEQPKDVEKIIIQHDIELLSNIANNDQSQVQHKQHSANASQPNNRRTVPKPIQQKKPVTVHRPSILRKKANESIGLSSKNIDHTIKSVISKNNLKPYNILKPSEKALQAKQKNWRPLIAKTLNSDKNKLATNDGTTSPDNHQVTRVDQQSETLFVSDIATKVDKINETQNVELKDVTLDKSAVSIFYKDEEPKPSIYTEPDKNSPFSHHVLESKEKDILVPRETFTVNDNFIVKKELSNCIMHSTTECDVHSSKTGIKSINESTQYIMNNKGALYKKRADEYIVIMNKGETVRLKLNLVISNENDVSDVCSHNNAVLKSPDISNPKIEPGPQVNLMTPGSTNGQSADKREVFMVNSSMESSLSSTITSNQKNIVVQCGCCEKIENEMALSMAPVFADNNNYFFFMPPENIYENVQSWRLNFKKTATIHYICRRYFFLKNITFW